MSLLAKFREEHPQFNHMSDEQLADALHSRFYSKTPIDQFYKQIGLPTAVPEARLTFKDKLEDALKRYSGDFLTGVHQDANVVRGLKDAVGNTAIDMANIIPGVSIKEMKSGSGPFYDLGNVAGNVGTFLGGGEMLDAARGAARGIPLAGKFLEKGLGGGIKRDILKRALGSAAYGAVTSPQDRLEGAALGAGLSGGLEGVGQLPEFLSKLSPVTQARNLVDWLGKGKTQEQNAKDVASDAKDALLSRKGEANVLYNPVFDALGSSRIYDGGVSEPSYLDLDKSLLSSYDKDLRKKHEIFIKKPTLKNAHALKRHINENLYKAEDALLANKYNIPSQDLVSDLSNSVDPLKSDIMRFLDKENPSLANQYRRASDYWREHVVPYKQNRNFHDIASGKKTNPGSLHHIFKKPEPYMLKVLGDLPPETRNKIVYEKLGKSGMAKKPARLDGAFHKLDEQGLGEYITPELHDRIEGMAKAAARQKGLQRVGGGAAALALTHGMIPLEYELGSGLLGSAVGPALLKPIFKGISAVGKPIFPLANQARPFAITQFARGDNNGS